MNFQALAATAEGLAAVAADPLIANVNAVAAIDYAIARARYASQIGGVAPTILPDPAPGQPSRFQFVGARHLGDTLALGQELADFRHDGGDDARVAHVNELLRRVAAAHPDTTVFVTGPQEYCTDPAIAADLAYRWDGVHAYKPGANLTMQAITRQLLEIPVP